ncbi:MAG: ATP-binding protein [Lachnospiraceae bacterium]|nr:ATP-binding protein [Lachnospiraceae bacterium]
MEQISVDAVVENINIVTDFVNEQLERYGCPMKAQMQIDIAIDELFGNIAHYAYSPEIGPATVCVEVTDRMDPGSEPEQELDGKMIGKAGSLAVIITFIDHGVPYDPLSGADPDVTLSAEERDIGGLGIYMVKKSMDEIFYEYKEGRNILRVKKHF